MNLRYEDRERVTLHARYRLGHGPERTGIVIDISPRGCRMLERMAPLPLNSVLVMEIGHVRPISARVRWHEGSFYGIEFARPIHDAVLRHMYRAVGNGD